MVGIPLRLYSWLRTSPLLMTHAGVEDWLWTLTRVEIPPLYESDFMSHEDRLFMSVGMALNRDRHGQARNVTGIGVDMDC
jgi:hypothetical protein